jgi:NADH-quinone oxidoreductase E subunit
MALEFSAQSKQRIDKLVARYPNKQAALLPVLHVAQDEFGHLPDDVVELVARTLDLPAAHIYGVITFYTMFHREKHGRNELMVCTNISCMLRGGYDILHHIEKRLGIKPGQTTPDGAFTLIEEECLAACANAPMMICGNKYFLDLTPQKVDVILDELRRKVGTKS